MGPAEWKDWRTMDGLCPLKIAQRCPTSKRCLLNPILIHQKSLCIFDSNMQVANQIPSTTIKQSPCPNINQTMLVS